VVNGIVISVGVQAIALSIVPAKLAAAIVTFATNFALRRALLFAPKAVQQ